MPDEPHIPDRLRDDLRRLHARRLPEDAEGPILEPALRELRAGRSRRDLGLTRLLLAGSGLAAALALGITIHLLQAGRPPAPPLAPHGRGALAMKEAAPSADPATGREAFTLAAPGADLARRADADSDLNGDGLVNILDARILAVAIERGATDATSEDLRALIARIVAIGEAS